MATPNQDRPRHLYPPGNHPTSWFGRPRRSARVLTGAVIHLGATLCRIVALVATTSSKMDRRMDALLESHYKKIKNNKQKNGHSNASSDFNPKKKRCSRQNCPSPPPNLRKSPPEKISTDGGNTQIPGASRRIVYATRAGWPNWRMQQIHQSTLRKRED